MRFVEVTVNGPKSWSLAAALHPDVSAALDGAQDKAAAEIVGWVVQHATTRVGPRGRQVQVPVERIESAVTRHYTSRSGDLHRHLHPSDQRPCVRRLRLASVAQDAARTPGSDVEAELDHVGLGLVSVTVG